MNSLPKAEFSDRMVVELLMILKAAPASVIAGLNTLHGGEGKRQCSTSRVSYLGGGVSQK